MTMRDRLHDRATPTGVGLGLRGVLLDAIHAGEADGKLAFLEICPENYMRRGGKPRRNFEAIAERFPIITHGVMLSLGSNDPLDAGYLSDLAGFVGPRATTWHSDHLCFSGHAGALLHDLLPLPMTRATVVHVAERIARAQDAIGKPLAIENISYYLPMPGELAHEAEFVSEVCERADCGLLLDVNNIYVNAKNFGFDPFEVLRGYPLDRVIQMHVAGHTRWERFDMWLDDHGATAEPIVHAMMQWVVERTGPLPILLERDKAIPSLAELLVEVADLQASYDAALARRADAHAPGLAEVGHG
ncbi:DUF692 domain-containing protein [Nannocystaceae bacterium ST9]